jgi:tetratricopeptide (TPR) repeat protein
VVRVAQALFSRGLFWPKNGNPGAAIGDYTRLFEQLPAAAVAQLANALFNRAVAWGKQGDSAREIADYTRLIEHLPGAPVEQIAEAYIPASTGGSRTMPPMQLRITPGARTAFWRSARCGRQAVFDRGPACGREGT